MGIIKNLLNLQVGWTAPEPIPKLLGAGRAQLLISLVVCDPLRGFSQICRMQSYNEQTLTDAFCQWHFFSSLLELNLSQNFLSGVSEIFLRIQSFYIFAASSKNFVPLSMSAIRGGLIVKGIAYNAYPQNILCLKCVPTNFEILLHIKAKNSKIVSFLDLKFALFSYEWIVPTHRKKVRPPSAQSF